MFEINSSEKSALPRRAIVKLENVNLVFKTSVHRPWTWRELFIRGANDPLDLLASARDRLHICKNISFEIYHGDRIGLLGVNGVGKTSLCRAIAGFYEPTSGKVETAGSVRALFDVATGIQPELTGRENAWLLAELLYPGHPHSREAIDESLEFSELGDFLDVPFKIYSKGMQARLGLSITAFKPADLLILDEVFDGADMFFREKIAARMLQLMDVSGAVLFVSHSREQIQKVCNRVIVLNDGQVFFDGRVDDGIKAFESLRPPPARSATLG